MVYNDMMSSCLFTVFMSVCVNEAEGDGCEPVKEGHVAPVSQVYKFSFHSLHRHFSQRKKIVSDWLAVR